MEKIKRLIERWRKQGPVRWSEGRFGWIVQEGHPIRLLPWQRAVLNAWWRHRDTTTTLAMSNVKKTGKTTADALLLAWRWLALPGEHFACANDMDQSQGRQFRMIADAVRRNPLLSQRVKVTRSILTFEPTGSTLEALSVDAAGNAGANHLTSSHTEAWGILYEEGVRAYEELTPQPGLFYGLPAMRIADSYAGWEGESETWHNLLNRALLGKRVDKVWPLYQSGGLLVFHMQGGQAQERCFRGTEAQRRTYYKDQLADLRPGTYRRLHLNERASNEGAFITAAQWDACILDSFRCPGPDPSLDLSVGVDLAVRRDCAAVVSVFKKDDAYWLGPLRIWKPPVSLEAVEAYIRRLSADYGYISVTADPYQAEQMLERLGQSGISAVRYDQTIGNLTMMGNRLFDAIREGRLVVWSGSDELRQHILSANGKEGSRGIRLVKGTGKIDAAVALGMACVTARTSMDPSDLFAFW